MTNLIERLQSSMRRGAALRYEAVPVPPFTVFLHRTDPLLYLNYAIPDGPLPDDVQEPLRRLREVFTARGRVPRFEYVAALAPSLEASLLAAGFQREAEARLMVCAREDFTPAARPEGFSASVLTPGSPPEELRAYCETARRSFLLGDTQAATEEQLAQLRRDVAQGGAVLGRWEGQPVGVGMFTAPLEGIAELAGVGTLEHARKRGVGTALTSRVAQEAFARGVELLFLSTITEEAGRIYERVGFRFATRMLFYSAPDTPTP